MTWAPGGFDRERGLWGLGCRLRGGTLEANKGLGEGVVQKWRAGGRGRRQGKVAFSSAGQGEAY